MSRFGDKHRTGGSKGKLKPLADIPDVIPRAPFKSYYGDGFGMVGSLYIPPHGRSVFTRTTNKLNDAMKQLATAEEWGLVKLSTFGHILSVKIQGLTVYFRSDDYDDEKNEKLIRIETSKGEKVFPNTNDGAKEAAGLLYYLLSDPVRKKEENEAAAVREAKKSEEEDKRIAEMFDDDWKRSGTGYAELDSQEGAGEVIEGGE
jgi:hypothetical protein